MQCIRFKKTTKLGFKIFYKVIPQLFYVISSADKILVVLYDIKSDCGNFLNSFIFF
jgi:hypothetical protein